MRIKGFTLIELLIVIAVLGILAIAVLAAINPIEQINRSRDTGSRSDSEQLISAIDRYYASKGYYPWMTHPTADDAVTWQAVSASWTDGGSSAVLDNLSTATGELKSSFVTRIQAGDYNTLMVYNSGEPGTSVYSCFLPRSDAFTDDADGRCAGDDAHGPLPPDFPASACGGPGANFSCLP